LKQKSAEKPKLVSTFLVTRATGVPI